VREGERGGKENDGKVDEKVEGEEDEEVEKKG